MPQLTFPHRLGRLHLPWPVCPCPPMSQAILSEYSDWWLLYGEGTQNAGTGGTLSPSWNQWVVRPTPHSIPTSVNSIICDRPWQNQPYCVQDRFWVKATITNYDLWTTDPPNLKSLTPVGSEIWAKMYPDRPYYNFTASAIKHCHVRCTQKSVYFFFLSPYIKIIHSRQVQSNWVMW